MKCPRCKCDLSAQRVQFTDINSCPQCGGMFLDHGQLNKVAEPTDGDLEFSTVDLDSFEHADDFGKAECPRCRGAVMKKVEFVIHTNIILDYCDRCRGFWLDGRELERIDGEVRRLNAASRDATTPPMMWFAYFIWSLPR